VHYLVNKNLICVPWSTMILEKSTVAQRRIMPSSKRKAIHVRPGQVDMSPAGWGSQNC